MQPLLSHPLSPHKIMDTAIPARPEAEAPCARARVGILLSTPTSAAEKCLFLAYNLRIFSFLGMTRLVL